MKIHALIKTASRWMVGMALIATSLTWAANGVNLSKSPEVSGTQEGSIHIPKEQERMALNYVKSTSYDPT